MRNWEFALALALYIHILSPFASAVLEILSPRSGSVLEYRDVKEDFIRVKTTQESPANILMTEGDGIECARSRESNQEIKAVHIWSVGFHNVTAKILDGNGDILQSAVSYFLVVDTFSEFLPTLDCATLGIEQEAEDEIKEAGSAQRGFGISKWKNHRRCLETFLNMYPEAAGTTYQYARLLEAEGTWEEAAHWYLKAARTGIPSHLTSVVDTKLQNLAQLIESRKKRPKCSWERVDSCAVGEEGSWQCSLKDRKEIHGHAAINTELSSDLFLSIIMVTRHDSTQFCQVPRDACLDRLRASLSVLLHRLSSAGLASSTEIILTEYNPCYLSSKQEEGACDPREDGGYMSLEEAVRTLVDIPPHPTTVRILLVTEEMHDSLYNPYGFDLMEFIGKNAAARRARGRFLLFTNPDDCLTEAMATMLARRRLRDDVVYTTFRGGIEGHVPVGRNASAESMSAFLRHNGYSSEHHPLSVAHRHGRWRRAACAAGEADDEPMRGKPYGYYHDSAAGDFLLLSRRAFHRFRGYPEIPTNIMIDGTAIHAAAAHGYGELVLAGECVVLHQAHPRSYNTKGSMISLEAYEALAQQLLDAGPAANIRPGTADDDDGPGPADDSGMAARAHTESTADEEMAARAHRESTSDKEMAARAHTQSTADKEMAEADDPGKRPWHHWNGREWGLEGLALPEVVLAPWCEEAE